MPFLLMVFLVLVCLPPPEVWFTPLWTDSPWLCVAATWVLVALTVLHAFLVSRSVCKTLESEPALRESLLSRYERRRFHHQIGLFAIYLAVLLAGGWGWAVSQLWRGDGAAWSGAELLVLLPFLIGQLLAWAVFYDAERAAHRAAHRLLAAEPHAGLWLELERPHTLPPPHFGSRSSYVLFQLRQKLALALLPVLLLVCLKELQRRFPTAWEQHPQALNFGGIAEVLIVFAAMPWIIRLVLGLTPMPDGPLRRRLQATARRLRFRHSNILIWNTRNGMANAMVVGILPWVRYVIFTDRLLEDFTPDEIEAVFGHEVGHIRHHHMLYYFSFLTASVIVLGCVINEILTAFPGFALLGSNERQLEWFKVAALVIVLLAYIFVVFGFLSRRCERQADVFGCRAVSCPTPDCRGHDEDVAFSPRGQSLCSTGIATFIRALEKVAFLNGISRDHPGFLQSWQHATIGRRIEFLQQMQLDRSLEKRFQRRVFAFKCVLLLLLGGALAFLLVHEAKTPTEEPRRDREGAVSIHRIAEQ
jgi:STE24 endopeptidase